MKLPSKLHHWLKRIKPPSLRIRIAPDHLMVVLKKQLDWDLLEEIVINCRKRKIKNAAGRKPHLLILLGAVIVRCLKSCTLRETAELIRYFAPARHLCGLGLLSWTPDFRTISDFEIMLGPEGLNEINDHILHTAHQAGFVDIKGLCSDTTAQEARIPYPNEVGLMNSFARSVSTAARCLTGKSSALLGKICSQTTLIKKLVRKHRLFCKKRPEKRKVEKRLLSLTSKLRHMAERFLQKTNQMKTNWRGQRRKARAQLTHLVDVFRKLEPQIAYYLRHNTAIKDKIISIYQPLLRAIVRGKAGKSVEFGLKWGINQIRGGYVALYFLTEKVSEQDYAVAGVREHIRLFGQAPQDFGYDRGGWSADHLQKIKKLGVRNVAVAPKGKAVWLVRGKCRERMVRERAQVEGKIGTLKMGGFNKPLERSETGMKRAGYRSVLAFNLKKLTRDLAAGIKKGVVRRCKKKK